MKKPYVIMLSRVGTDFFALDRSYDLIEGEWDTKIDIKDIVQSESFEGCPYYQGPDWAKNTPLIALWTNYYD